MEIYLVRHGETGGNIAHRHQQEDTKLSDRGKNQARVAADKIKQINPTHLVTSNLIRTLQTAQIIGEACDLTPETNPHFIELVRPKHMYGHYHRSFKSIWFYIQWYLGLGVGGESYKDFLKRFQLAKNSLSSYPKDARIVVVSHTVFINLFIAHLCRNKVLNPFMAVITFYKVLTMPNTHITPILFDEEGDFEGCAWSVNK